MALTQKAYSNNFEGLDACVLLEHGFGKSGGSVHSRNICGENRHLRQARNRQI
jgi:hypothetical protein